MRATKSFVSFVALGGALAAATGLFFEAGAQDVPKQGQIDAVVTDATTGKTLAISPEQTLYALDMVLVANASSGNGLLHNMTGHCLAHEEAENANGASTVDGYCTYVDSDGDQIFETVTMTRSGLHEEATGEAKITGGTGKYEGITGDLTHTRRLLLPSPAEGVFPGIGQITGSYQIN